VSCLSRFVTNEVTDGISPKPQLPEAKEYEVPEAPNRDLGPPPPGYGRYADAAFTTGGGTGHFTAGAQSSGFVRRNLDEVTCFKVSFYTRISWYESNAIDSVENEATTQICAQTGMYLATEEASTELPRNALEQERNEDTLPSLF
jgi:hypothetical protein